MFLLMAGVAFCPTFSHPVCSDPQIIHVSRSGFNHDKFLAHERTAIVAIYYHHTSSDQWCANDGCAVFIINNARPEIYCNEQPRQNGISCDERERERETHM